MKTILILITLFLMCGTASAISIDEVDHYMIVVIVWNNETGVSEEGVPVTFGGIYALHTESDGSVVFDTANIDNVEHGAVVLVDCKYGNKSVPIIYQSNGVRNWGTAVTFNEPDESTVVETLATMGIVAVSIGGGIYLLRRKTNIEVENTNTDIIEDDTMTENIEGWKMKRDFGVRAWIATLSLIGYATVAGIAVYQGNAEMMGTVSQMFMPVVMAVVVFYFGGAMVRDGTKK